MKTTKSAVDTSKFSIDFFIQVFYNTAVGDKQSQQIQEEMFIMCHNKNQLRSAVAKYRKLRAQKAELDKQIAEVQDQIYEYFDYNNLDAGSKVIGQNYTVIYQNVDCTSWDKKALTEELGDRVSSFQKKRSYRRLFIR